MAVILASRSPRRKQLLSLIFPLFEVAESHFDESLIEENCPNLLVEKLSLCKAKAVRRMETDLVIGADTVVVSPDGAVFGIPQDHMEAFSMLHALSGKTHRVVTGVSLLCGALTVTFHVETKVFFRELDEGEMNAYICSGEPFDKAGGYGIQGKAAVFIEKIEGDFYNVMGLPVAALYQTLKKHDLLPAANQ